MHCAVLIIRHRHQRQNGTVRFPQGLVGVELQSAAGEFNFRTEDGRNEADGKLCLNALVVMHARYVRSQLRFQRAELLFGDVAVVIDLADLLCGQIFRRGDGIKAMTVNRFLKPFSAELYSGGILECRRRISRRRLPQYRWRIRGSFPRRRKCPCRL